MRALRCPHHGHPPGAVAIVAIVALASLRRWHHCEYRPGAAWASSLSRRWRHCRRCPGAVAIVAVVALVSLRRWHHCRRCPGSLAPPPSQALTPASWSLAFLPSSQHNRRPSGPVPLHRPLFRVDLFDCLGFGSRPNGHATRLLSQRRQSLGLRLLGRPSSALDTQQGRLLAVIQNLARSLLLPVIPVPSGLVPLLGRHHPGKSNAGTGVRLRHTLTFVTERTAPAPWSPMSHR
jgi:hypothetical protein